MLTVEEENSLPLSASLMRASADAGDEILASFYGWLDQKYSSREYASIQADYDGKFSPKFLAVCHRTKRLMPIAKWLSWDRKCNLRNLDLGSGPGHMGLIASFFGHNNLGIDRSSLYDRLREFWMQPAIIHSIEPRSPLPPIGKFHTITSILTNYGRRWGIGDWEEFLNRMIAEHLEPDGEFVLNFPGRQNLKCREYLRQRASRLEHGGRFMFFCRN